MTTKMIAIILSMVTIIIVSVLVSTAYKRNDSRCIERFSEADTVNQYTRDLGINRGAINSNLYNHNLLSIQDDAVYAFESNIMISEENIYNTEKYDCAEVWDNWSNCDTTKLVCDGYSTTGTSIRTRNLIRRFPARNGGKPCESDTMICTFDNACPFVNKLEYCPAWQRDGIPTDHHCMITNGGIYLNGGLFNRNFINGGDTCIIALSLWKDDLAYWTGMVGIGNGGYHSFLEISNSGGIALRGQWGADGWNNIIATARCEKYRAVILVSRNDIESAKYPLFRMYSHAKMGNGFGIYMNGGMFARNFIDNGDMCIVALTMWTDTAKSWTGVIGICHLNYPGQETFFPLWNNSVDIWQGWDCCGANYTMFSGVNSGDGNVYYKANVLISKNDFNDIAYKTYKAEWRLLSLGFVIDMSNMFDRNLITKKDQLIIAMVIWTNKRKCWSGLVAINNNIRPGSQSFKLLWNLQSQDIRNETLTVKSGGQDFIVINGAESTEEMYYRANILNSKNKI